MEKIEQERNRINVFPIQTAEKKPNNIVIVVYVCYSVLYVYSENQVVNIRVVFVYMLYNLLYIHVCTKVVGVAG